MPPTWLCVSTSPGMIHFPAQSITVAPVPRNSPLPTSLILPSSTTTYPFSISAAAFPPLSIGITRAFTNAVTSARADVLTKSAAPIIAQHTYPLIFMPAD